MISSLTKRRRYGQFGSTPSIGARWLPSLGYSIGAASANIFGPCVAAAQNYLPGCQIAQNYLPGAQMADEFIPGCQAAETAC